MFRMFVCITNMVVGWWGLVKFTQHQNLNMFTISLEQVGSGTPCPSVSPKSHSTRKKYGGDP